MEKRILKGKRVIPPQALGTLLIIPIIGYILYSNEHEVWGIILMSLYLLVFLMKKRVVINYQKNTIRFYSGCFFNTYKATKFQKCKIKVYTKSYGNTVGNGVGYSEQYYSIAKKALYIADIVNKEEKLVKIGEQKELEIIAEELEENFGIVRV